MKRVQLTSIAQVKDQATAQALRDIELASADENIVDIAQAFTITGTYTDTRTLNVGTSTLAQTQAFIATLIKDLQRGGQHRTN